MSFGTSWQPPRKMSKKDLESVLVLGLAMEKMSRKYQENDAKMSRDIFQTLLNMFWPTESQKGARARAKRARAPFWVAAEGRHLSVGQKMSKKCLENVSGHFWDSFLTFSGHFSSANPSTRLVSDFLVVFSVVPLNFWLSNPLAPGPVCCASPMACGLDYR